MAIESQSGGNAVQAIEDREVEPSDADLADGEEYLLSAESEQTPVLSVVMPTLDEEEGIALCIEWVKRAVAELEVPTEILVSDSSVDKTPEIAEELGAIVVEPDEPGYGYAYRYAFERARGDFVAMGDADTTYDFRDLPRLLEELRAADADIVMGSRLEGEIEPGSMPALHKYVGNPLLTRFLNAFYDAGVSDAHSGFRVLTAEALDAIDLETTGMEFASEMVMDAAAKDLEIVEVPITYHERRGEETLDSFRDGWRHVRFMLVNAPGYLFSGPGVAMTTLGLATMALVFAGVPVAGRSPGLHSAIAGSLLTILGIQVVSMGVFASVAGNTIRNPQGPVTTWIREHLTLERGATAGTAVLGLGVLGVASLLYGWYGVGFTSTRFTMYSMYAFTAIVVGAQIVFASFFLSALAGGRNG